ncbi:MAG TPA: hypothetical protein VK836_24085 [Streptosporangiaceae bacterium]|nr:hypothetical protein [Streptosporangiaceae bacterium]
MVNPHARTVATQLDPVRNGGANTLGTIGDLVCDAQAAGSRPQAARPDWTCTGCWITRHALTPPGVGGY